MEEIQIFVFINLEALQITEWIANDRTIGVSFYTLPHALRLSFL